VRERAATSGSRQGRTLDTGPAVVRDDAARLLVVLRRNPPQAGRWALPGGRCLADESTAETARREVEEETGLRIKVGAVVGAIAFGGYHVTDHAAVIVGGALSAGDDALDARFVTDDELAALPCTDGLLDTLRRWGVLA